MCSMYSINSSSTPLQYTEKEGLRLGLVGWVKNTYSGTVVGQVQGPADMVEKMWVHVVLSLFQPLDGDVHLQHGGPPVSNLCSLFHSVQIFEEKIYLDFFPQLPDHKQVPEHITAHCPPPVLSAQSKLISDNQSWNWSSVCFDVLSVRREWCHQGVDVSFRMTSLPPDTHTHTHTHTRRVSDSDIVSGVCFHLLAAPGGWSLMNQISFMRKTLKKIKCF